MCPVRALAAAQAVDAVLTKLKKKPAPKPPKAEKNATVLGNGTDASNGTDAGAKLDGDEVREMTSQLRTLARLWDRRLRTAGGALLLCRLGRAGRAGRRTLGRRAPLGTLGLRAQTATRRRRAATRLRRRRTTTSSEGCGSAACVGRGDSAAGR